MAKKRMPACAPGAKAAWPALIARSGPGLAAGIRVRDSAGVAPMPACADAPGRPATGYAVPS